MYFLQVLYQNCTKLECKLRWCVWAIGRRPIPFRLLKVTWIWHDKHTELPVTNLRIIKAHKCSYFQQIVVGSTGFALHWNLCLPHPQTSSAPSLVTHFEPTNLAPCGIQKENVFPEWTIERSSFSRIPVFSPEIANQVVRRCKLPGGPCKSTVWLGLGLVALWIS